MRFADLLNALPDDMLMRVDGDADVAAPVVESTADLQPGGVFIARKGLSTDGHRFIPDAVAKGAAAVIGQEPPGEIGVPYAQVRDPQAATGLLAAAYHGFPSRRLVVIGVTGTDGKTTTTTLIHSILKQTFKTGYISTLAADLGESTSDTGLHVTTPGAPQVQAYLAQMVANGLEYCVLEMTSHGLAQGRLNGVDIDVAVLTNLRHEHLDFHGSFENYRAAKAIMFEMLSRSERNRVPKTSVINDEDPNADFFKAIATDRLMAYSLDEVAVDYAPDGTRFTLGGESYTLGLVGAFNVMNALAAVKTAQALDVGVDSIKRGLAAVQAISGRMQRIDEGQVFTAIVDFAHTPNALENALRTCRMMLGGTGRLIAVFGSAGLRDVGKRRMMAETAAQLADFTVLTAEDPRTESLDAILQMMAEGCEAQGGVEGETFIRVPDRGVAIYHACQMAQPDDIVIACGKGHEQSMCFGTVEYPWDDRDAMRSALRGTPLGGLPTASSETD